MRRLPQSRRFPRGLILGALMLVLTGALLAPAGPAQAAGEITGFVFRDYNSNGVLDANEIGVGGVTVSAYAASSPTPVGSVTTFETLCLGPGNPIAACTGANTPAIGSYRLNAGGVGPYRIEFSNWPAYLLPSAQGASNNTSVQFVPDGNSANINFALHNPAEYCQSNPRLMITCFQPGDAVNGPNADEAVIYSQNYTDNGTTPAPTEETLANQIGSVWGLAYQRSTNTLFVASYTKRNTTYGPGLNGSDGTGTIYRVTPGGAADGAPFVDLDDIFGANTTGADPHTDLDPTNNDNDFDSGAYGVIGKMGLGDLDISEDETTLWVVNMADQGLYSIDIASQTAQLRGDIGFQAECTSGFPVRPFGLGIRDGLVYVGGVCAAEGLNDTSADLRAFVFIFDPATDTFAATPALQFDLDYPRGCADIAPGGYLTVDGFPAPGGCLPAEWLPWRDTFPTSPYSFSDGDPAFGGFPQPMLSDIAFDGDDMVLAFRDRFVDQLGNLDPGPNEDRLNGVELNAIPAGDVLRASPDGSGGWTIENNAQSNPAGLFGPTAGVNNGQGPGGGEFYHRDDMVGTNRILHDELVLGGMVIAPGLGNVVLGAFDPTTEDNLFSSGTIQLSNTTGARVRGYQLTQPGSGFGKANGLGDLEILCDQAPIEIGNRVWLDINSNGVQDPGETPLVGVRVELWLNGTLVGFTTTDANGTYYFRGLTPGTVNPNNSNLSGYEVRIPNITGSGQQSALTGLTLTTALNDGSPNGASRDSNGTASGNNAVYPIPFGNLARAGSNNHTYDFGFYRFTPSAVVLEYFNAVREGGGVTLRWATAMELDTAGFHILRSSTGLLEDARVVTPALIRAQGRANSGASYEWVDTSAVAGVAYTYWLEELETTGRLNRYGPALAPLQPAAGIHRVMLPLLTR